MPLGLRHCQGTSAHGLDPNAPSMANAHLIMLWFRYDFLLFLVPEACGIVVVDITVCDQAEVCLLDVASGNL